MCVLTNASLPFNFCNVSCSQVIHDGRLVTVFSAPNYCDQMGNKGAFVRFNGSDMVSQAISLHNQWCCLRFRLNDINCIAVHRPCTTYLHILCCLWLLAIRLAQRSLVVLWCVVILCPVRQCDSSKFAVILLFHRCPTSPHSQQCHTPMSSPCSMPASSCGACSRTTEQRLNPWESVMSVRSRCISMCFKQGCFKHGTVTVTYGQMTARLVAFRRHFLRVQ